MTRTEEPEDIRGLIEIQGQKNDILRSAIQHVSPNIAQSFDELCGSELEEIDQLYSLSDHFKSGQQLSLQNRPTGVAVQD
jgi:hypothetical protein